MNIPAYIVGLDLNGLGVLRSLAPHVKRIVCCDTSLQAPGMRSRFGQKKLLSTLSGQALVDELVALARLESSRPVLFLTQEASVLTVSEHRQQIQQHFRLALAEHDVLTALMNKDQFHQLAEKFDAPLPRSVTVLSPADIAQLARLDFPCILKPAYKDYGYGEKFKKAYVVQSQEEARRLYAEIAPTMAEMVVQEWIEGEDQDIYFCLQYRDTPARALQNFVGRKLRSWPPEVGGTASCTAALEHIEEAVRLTDTFFSQTGFLGMGGIEYKFDRNRKQLRMIEPTVARTDMQHEVAVLNGCNLVLTQYLAEAGLAQPPAMSATYIPPATRYVWRDYVADAWSQQTKAVAVPLPQNSHNVDAHFRWNDPGPALSPSHLSNKLKCGLRKLVPGRS